MASESQRSSLSEWIKALEPVPLHDGFKVFNKGAKEIRDYLIQLRDLIGEQNGTKHN